MSEGTIRQPLPAKPAGPDVEAKLLALEDEAFRQIVDDDLRDFEHSGAYAMALRSPAIVDRWHSTLTAMLKSVDGQLAARGLDWEATRARIAKERLDIEADDGLMPDEREAKLIAKDREHEDEREQYAKSRAGTMRFKTGLEEWLVDARRIKQGLTDRLYDSVVTRERNYYAERARSLEEGITQHQKVVIASSLPTEADEALWSLLQT